MVTTFSNIKWNKNGCYPVEVEVDQKFDSPLKALYWLKERFYAEPIYFELRRGKMYFEYDVTR